MKMDSKVFENKEIPTIILLYKINHSKEDINELLKNYGFEIVKIDSSENNYINVYIKKLNKKADTKMVKDMMVSLFRKYFLLKEQSIVTQSVIYIDIYVKSFFKYKKICHLTSLE